MKQKVNHPILADNYFSDFRSGFLYGVLQFLQIQTRFKFIFAIVCLIVVMYEEFLHLVVQVDELFCGQFFCCRTASISLNRVVTSDIRMSVLRDTSSKKLVSREQMKLVPLTHLIEEVQNLFSG